MAFQQALSGLNAASKAIDATSNNIANSSTVGYKASTAHFGDVFASSMAGAGANQIGNGVSISAVQQQLSQGAVTSTNNPLDISTNGNGFFRMEQNGAVSYTRNGQFHVDKNGFVINDQGMNVTGYPVQAGVIATSAPSPLKISAADLAPVETGTGTSLAFRGVKANVQLDSRDAVKTTSWNPGATPTDPLSYNYSTTTSIYDSLGNAHNLSMFFVKTATPGKWETHLTVDGTSDANVNGGVPGLLTFDQNGKLVSGSPFPVNINLAAVNTALGVNSNAKSPMGFNLSFADSTQYGSPSGINSMEQDGYTAGHLVSLSVGADGMIQGRYSNGQNANQGQVVLANFTNPNGLQSLGNNQWSETSISGSALVGAPSTSNLGVLTSSSIEESNVDLTAELVNLITQQRNYQANAQSIKTQDQIMQTLINIR